MLPGKSVGSRQASLADVCARSASLGSNNLPCEPMFVQNCCRTPLDISFATSEMIFNAMEKSLPSQRSYSQSFLVLRSRLSPAFGLKTSSGNTEKSDEFYLRISYVETHLERAEHL